jgi:hypothetical protein
MMIKLETKAAKTAREIKGLLQEWLENDDLEEIVLMGKLKDKRFSWDHSGMTSTFWWMGCLAHLIGLLSSFQMED